MRKGRSNLMPSTTNPISAVREDHPPLIVDLDGTLIPTDMLHGSALRSLRERPIATLFIPA